MAKTKANSAKKPSRRANKHTFRSEIAAFGKQVRIFRKELGLVSKELTHLVGMLSNPLSSGERETRKRQGLTLEQLAERVGISANFLGAVERGKVNPSVSVVVCLARGLGVAPGELLGGGRTISPRAREFAELFDSLPGGMKRVVLELLRTALRLA
jgi:transcriptional regulator with XRE-family HTH domain